MSNATWIGARVKELREAKGWTQTQLAGQAGLTLDGLSRIERANRMPSWETVVALAEALGVTCEAFTQPPAGREPSGRGRPAKPKAEAEEAKPKRPRGRPKKGER